MRTGKDAGIRKLMRLLAFFASTTALVLPASAQVYQWKDADGNTAFGDKPPADARDVRTLKPARAPSTDANDAGPNLRNVRRQQLLEDLQQSRQERTEQRAKAAEEAAERQRNCARARDQLRGYQQARGVYELDSKGNRVVLGEEQHRAAIANAQAQVRTYCN